MMRYRPPAKSGLADAQRRVLIARATMMLNTSSLKRL
jgi:hypothetical protein